MTTTICGHDRETLKRVLFAMTSPACNPSCDFNGAPWDAYVAIHNPARLAEILIETLRGIGITEIRVDGVTDTSQNQWAWKLKGPHIWALWHAGDNKSAQNSWTMPQARALLLRLLQLPDGATADDTMKALEVGT